MTKHLAPSFPFTDEFYQPKDHLARQDRRRSFASIWRTSPESSLHLKGDYPLAWAKTYGKGRVFFGSFAHSSATWDIRDIQQMYFEAMRWALG